MVSSSSAVEIVSICALRVARGPEELGSMIVTTKGSIGVKARREAVWAALHDVERLALCVPGCREVIRASDGSYRVSAAVRFGPVRVAFDGVIEIGECQAPGHLALIGRGRGGRAGTATGTATIRIAEHPGGCYLSYELQAHPDGPVARLGSLALTAIAARLSMMFAHCFAQLFEDAATRRAATRWRPKSLGQPTIS